MQSCQDVYGRVNCKIIEVFEREISLWMEP
jgi:hypothetical protein